MLLFCVPKSIRNSDDRVFTMEESLKLFISYSHRDEKLQQQLMKHLAPLKSQKVIETWHDRQIPAGTEWANEIDENLNNADIILLLVSPDFVASDYCSNIELSIAMERHQQGAAIVIPVVLEPCDWSWLPFAKFQAFPKDAMAVTSWSNQNEAFVDVAIGIRKVAQSILTQRQESFREEETDRERYKAKVEQVLSISINGKISVADRDTLDELYASLDLTAEDAKQVEDSAYKPFVDKIEKQDKYKKTLLKYIEEYPFPEDVTKQLENRQKDLGLKNEDIEQVVQPILAEAEAKYQEKIQIEAYLEAIKIDPNDADAHYNLGIALGNQGKYEEAITSYLEAIKIDSNYAIAHNNIGAMLEAQGKLEEATTSYRTAIKIDPDLVIAHYNLGASLGNQGKHEEEIASYREVIRIDSNYADAHYNLGVSLGNQGKHEEAIECYRQAIQVDPNYAIAHNNLGVSLENQGKYEEAIECYRRAIQIDPNCADYHNNLGTCLASLRQGKKS